MAKADYFLKIEGVDGESTDDKHKGSIELETFSWSEVQQGSAGVGGGAGVGKVKASDLVITKKMDKSSPVLMIACATGQHYKKAVLTARRAGGGQQEYLKLTLEDVLVSLYEAGAANTNESVIPTETIKLNFDKLEMSYKEQKPDGSLGPEVKQKYDFAANKKV